MNKQITVVLPLWPKELERNVKVHWRVEARKTKQYRIDAGLAGSIAIYNLGEEERRKLDIPWSKATELSVCCFRDKRKHDKDNCQAALKAAYDGFKDAGILIDDYDLTHLPLERKVDRANPRVEITITQEDAK